MTGHAFQALLTDDDGLALLRAAHDHLARGGLMAFDTRNPARQAWLAWTPDRPRRVTTAEHGEVEERIEAAADLQTGISISPIPVRRFRQDDRRPKPHSLRRARSPRAATR